MTLRRILVLLFFGITIGFGLIFIPLYIGMLNGMNENLFTLATVIYLYVCTLALIYVPIGIVFVLIRLWTAITRQFPRIGRVILLSLVAAIVLYPSLIGTVFSRSITIGAALLQAPADLRQDWQTSERVCHETTTLANCTAILGFEFFSTWAQIFINSFDKISRIEEAPYGQTPTAQEAETTPAAVELDFPFGELIAMLVIGIVADQLLHTYWDSSGAAERAAGGNRLRLSSGFVRYGLFFALILLGLYLVIVSMIAIPAIEAEPPSLEQVSPETFASDITALRDQSSANRYDQVANNPLPALETYVRDTTGVPREVRLWLSTVKLQRTPLIAAYNSLIAKADGQRISTASMVISAYRNNTLGRIGAREMIEYYDTLVTYYQTEARAIDSLITTCTLNLQAVDTSWASVVAVLTGEGTNQEKIDYLDSYRGVSPYVLSTSCGSEDLPQTTIPDRAVLGSYLGAFGTLAGWLLAPESLSLALLVGMLGTGLLGAAVSPFILETEAHDAPPEGTADAAAGDTADAAVDAAAVDAAAAADAVVDAAGVVADVAAATPSTPRPKLEPELVFDVIIRGLVAAFVVFFAAQAGLIILGAETNQTNGYILLLVCLLAAMFSEIPLTATRKWFNGVLENLGQPGA